MKQPNWKVPLTLASVLMVLGTFSYWLAYSHKPKKEQADLESKKPLALPSDDTQIVQFRLKSTQSVIEGKCESLAQKSCSAKATGEWKLTYPIEKKADSDSIRDLLTQFTNMTATETINLAEESPEQQKHLLDEYGLSDSKRTSITAQFIELTLQDGKKLAAWFGEVHPVNGKFFVASTENGNLNMKTVYLINASAKSNFEKGLTHFREKSIFHFNRQDIDQFTAKTTSGTLKGKLDQGLWTLNGEAADHDRVETVLAAISQAKAQEFTSQEALKGTRSVLTYELHSPKETLQFELFAKNNKMKSGDDEINTPYFYLKIPGQAEIYQVEGGFKKQIDKRLGELRESALLKHTDKITATRLSLQGKAYTQKSEFHFDGKIWSQADSGMKLDASQISSFLDLLIESHATEIVSTLPSDKDKLESFTLALGDDAHAEKVKYLFFATAKGVYAQDLNQKAKEAYLLDPKLKSALPFKPEAWKLK